MNLQELCQSCLTIKGPENNCPHCGSNGSITPDSADDLMPGTLLERRYMVGKALGRNGISITYPALSIDSERRLIIKEYFPQGLIRREKNGRIKIIDEHREDDFRSGLQQFKRDSQLHLKLIDVPGILHAIEVFEANNSVYMVVENLRGKTLEQYLVMEGKRLDFSLAMELLKPLFRTLGELHDRNIIHRDVNPDNIFIKETGQIILMEFGLGKYSLGNFNNGVALNLKDGFRPEEQYRSGGKSSPATDIYALAATLYRMITGVSPLKSPSRLFDDTLQSPGTLGVIIPRLSETALMIALSVKATDRYQTIREFRDALVQTDDKSSENTLLLKILELSEKTDDDCQKKIERLSQIKDGAQSIDIEIIEEKIRKLNKKIELFRTLREEGLKEIQDKKRGAPKISPKTDNDEERIAPTREQSARNIQEYEEAPVKRKSNKALIYISTVGFVFVIGIIAIFHFWGTTAENNKSEVPPIEDFHRKIHSASETEQAPLIQADVNISGAAFPLDTILTPLVQKYYASIGLRDVHVSDNPDGSKLIQGKNADDRNITISLHPSQSSSAFQDLKDGKCHLVITTRPVNTQEESHFSADQNTVSSLAESVIGVGGIALIAHPDNPVNAIPVNKIADIFAGKIRDWKELGYNESKPINVYRWKDIHYLTEAFQSIVFHRAEDFCPQSSIIHQPDELIQRVISDENAIGFIDFHLTKQCKVLNIESYSGQLFGPERFTVKSEDYPLSYRIYLYTGAIFQNDFIQPLLTFALGRDGQKVIQENTRFLDLTVEASPPTYTKPQTPIEYARLLNASKRLSSTMFFTSDRRGIELDPKGEADLKRVLSFLDQNYVSQGNEFELTLVAFAWETEDDEFNKNVSGNLISILEKQFRRRGIEISGHNLGKGSPNMSNETSWGKMKNRRVELWIK